MNMSCPTGLPSVLDKAFFQQNWRQQPIVFRGGVGAFLRRRPARPQVVAATRNMTATTDSRTIWFLEGVTSGIPGIEELCHDATAFFEWEDVWCDVFYTKGASSIGAHLDNSDNFSLQVEGVKRWKLASPEGVPAEQRRLRVLGEPGAGDVGQEFAADFRVTLQPGDVLYIPLLWRHWGVSEGDSLSVSLVINAHTVWHSASQALVGALRQQLAWTAPVEVGPGTTQRRAGQIQAAIEMSACNLPITTITREAVTRMAIPRTGIYSTLSIDIDRVKKFVWHSPAVPKSDFIIATDGAVTARTLQSLLARRNLKQLLKIVVSRYTACADRLDKFRYQTAVEALLSLDDPEMELALTDPAVTSWSAVARSQEGETSVARAEDPLAHQLLWALLPCAVQHGISSLPDIHIAASASGALLAPQFGQTVRGGDGQSPWTVSTSPDGTVIASNGGIEAALTEGGQEHYLIAGTGVQVVPEADAWTSQHGLAQEDYHVASSAEEKALAIYFSEGLELLRQYLPAGAAEFETVIRHIIPMKGRGLTPHNFSVHAFRGLFLSTPRPSVMAAQIILHETGHNLMSTLIELVPLCANPDTKVVSPVVRKERSLRAVFHGAYSFAREAYFTWILVKAGVPPVEGTNMERYLAERTQVVSEARDVLIGCAELAPIGVQIVEEISAILDEIGPGRVAKATLIS